MKDQDQYLEAWTEDDTKRDADPVVSAVKAARAADAEAFSDAFKNDKFEEPKEKEKKAEDKKENA